MIKKAYKYQLSPIDSMEKSTKPDAEAFGFVAYRGKVDLEKELEDVKLASGMPERLKLQLVTGVHNLVTDDSELVTQLEDAEAMGLTHVIKATLEGAQNKEVAYNLTHFMIGLCFQLFKVNETHGEVIYKNKIDKYVRLE